LSFGIDHSSTPPDPAKLVAAGVHFVCRYLSTPGNPKNLTLAEAAALKLHQIDVVLVFETVAKEALKGRAAGVADAKSARQQATVCGLPDAPIYFAVDFDETPQEASVVHDYVAGAASVLGYDKTGGYGGYWVVKRLLDAKVCKYAWQTYAWSGGQWDVRAQLRQYLNGQKLAGISGGLRPLHVSRLRTGKAPLSAEGRRSSEGREGLLGLGSVETGRRRLGRVRTPPIQR